MTTLALSLHAHDVTVTRFGLCLMLDGTLPRQAADLLMKLDVDGFPDVSLLAAMVPDRPVDKYDDVIGDDLLTRSHGRHLAIPEAFPDDHPELPIGVIRVADGLATFVAGVGTGPVGSTVSCPTRTLGLISRGTRTSLRSAIGLRRDGSPSSRGLESESIRYPSRLRRLDGIGFGITPRIWT